MAEPHALGAAEAARLIASGRLTSKGLIESCLAHIAEHEDSVGAWTHLDVAGGRAQARALDRGGARGPLHGIPIGVKDIIDTVDMPTGYGSAIYDGHRPAWDAAAVAACRAAGAVILGKTVSTEFAYFTPGKTRNPHNPAHTPGGSSSGSAAAVADLMVPLAFGSQTAGSVIRPASFCGVVGFKPTFGLLSLAGVKPFAQSLDTLGFFSRSVEDAMLLLAALIGGRTMPEPLSGAPRIGVCRTPEWSHASPATQHAVDRAAALLNAAGARVVEVTLAEPFAGLHAAQLTIMAFESARTLGHERRRHGEHLSQTLLGLLAEGRACSLERYEAAQRLASRSRTQLDALFAGYDALLAPSAVGEAPHGLGRTGDPVFNRMWTLLHVPCITLPRYVGANRLPVGIQLVGARWADEHLLRVARWVEDRLAAAV
ncbi:MAG: amidase [Alphaproteobacteria bacterium]|nr:amidase [Alphaproteobacteria bacterium]